MRDTQRRENLAAQPLPSQRDPLSAAGTEPGPVDEAGLEHGQDRAGDDGRAVDHRSMTDRAMNDGAVNDGAVNDGGMHDGRAMDDVAPPERDATPDAMPPAQDTAQPVDAMPMPAAAPKVHDDELFAGDVAERLRARWRELQAGFVDDPQRAVREADEVVDEVMRAITEHRQRLAGEWQGHTDTEHLRLALREYRSFFDRLLPS